MISIPKKKLIKTILLLKKKKYVNKLEITKNTDFYQNAQIKTNIFRSTFWIEIIEAETLTLKITNLFFKLKPSCDLDDRIAVALIPLMLLDTKFQNFTYYILGFLFSCRL